MCRMPARTRVVPTSRQCALRAIWHWSWTLLKLIHNLAPDLAELGDALAVHDQAGALRLVTNIALTCLMSAFRACSTYCQGRQAPARSTRSHPMHDPVICSSRSVARGDRISVVDRSSSGSVWYDAVVVATHPEDSAYTVIYTRLGPGRRRAVISDYGHEDGTCWATPYEAPPPATATPIPGSRCHHCGALADRPCTTTCPLTTGAPTR